MWGTRISCLAAALSLAAPAAPAQNTLPLFQQGKIRALIFSGRNNHDWRATTPFLRKALVDTGRFDVRVEEEPAGTAAATLAAYDVLILDYNGPRWGAGTEKAVESFVRNGKGLVSVHGATWAFCGLDVLGDRHRRMNILEPPWPEYKRMVGACWTEQEPKTGHGQRHAFRVKLVDRGHPITAGMEETFVANDELYHQFSMAEGVHVLATAFDDKRIGGTGKDEPSLWTLEYGKGRSFHTALGHDVAAMQEAGFVTTFVRGAEWAATGKVSLPAKIDPLARPKDPARLLVVTGGHAYETSFYTVFEGHPDIAWTHAASSREAFAKDLRPDYDVLVLYDLSRALGEAGRKNLQDFVEGGKGVVVLHHAIADYTDWPWWWKEVVGGRYLEKPDGAVPASTYKHDEELIVRPAARHPITAGVTALHLWDETYKQMQILPGVTVLLTTDNPTSDGPLAWVSPYQKSRVVYVQLGHDRMAHLHDGYRGLVRNAILWAAGKLK